MGARSQRILIQLGCVLAMIAGAMAQSSPSSAVSAQPQTSASDQSVAGAVRDSKAQKAGHAKNVFTDEDMDAATGPLPKLKMDGIDNTDQIISEIGNYKKTRHARADGAGGARLV
jgi:hypothetical protein